MGDADRSFEEEQGLRNFLVTQACKPCASALQPEGYCHTCFNDFAAHEQNKLFCDNVCANKHASSKDRPKTALPN